MHIPDSYRRTGYIDFILKKKKEAEYRAPDEEGSTVTFTENIGGAQGTAIQFANPQFGRATEGNLGRVGTVKGILLLHQALPFRVGLAFFV